jgi:hypothetical protein
VNSPQGRWTVDAEKTIGWKRCGRIRFSVKKRIRTVAADTSIVAGVRACIKGAIARQMEAVVLSSKKPNRSLPVVFRAVILKRMSDVTRILSAIERGRSKRG